MTARKLSLPMLRVLRRARWFIRDGGADLVLYTNWRTAESLDRRGLVKSYKQENYYASDVMPNIRVVLLRPEAG